MYIVCLKDNVAVATAICKDLDTAKAQFTMYDDIQEITATEFDTMPIPSKFNNGEWVKVDETPIVDYPQTEKPTETTEPTTKSSVYDELAAAYKQGVQEA
jgi:hypothetical protein